MKIFILSLLLSTAALAKDVDCEQLYKDTDSACNSSEVECRNLGACVSKRKTCPMDIGSPSACESFDECMKDTDSLESKKPKDLARMYFKNRCIYTWNAGKCYLYNTGMEIFTFPSCPGRRMWGKGKSDKNFDCEGHRRLTASVSKSCKEETNTYVKLCKNKKDYKYRRVVKTSDCKYLNEKVFPADTEHKGSKKVDHGSRDRFKVIPHGDDGASGEGGGGKGAGK